MVELETEPGCQALDEEEAVAETEREPEFEQEGVDEGEAIRHDAGVSENDATIRWQILARSPLPKAQPRTRNHRAQVAELITASPYKEALEEKGAVRGRGKSRVRGGMQGSGRRRQGSGEEVKGSGKKVQGSGEELQGVEA